MVDLATSPDPKLRPPMKALGELATRVSKQLLGSEPLSVAAASPATKNEADAPQQSEPPLRLQVGSQGAFSAGPPLVAVPAGGIGGDSDGGGWATGGGGNGNVKLRQSEEGTVAGNTVCMPEVVVDDSAATGCTSPDATASATTAAGTSLTVDAAAAAAASTACLTNSGSGGVGGGGDGGGDGGGGGGGNTTLSSASKGTSATATDITASVSVENGDSTGNVECQGSMPDLVGIMWGSPSSVQNAISAPGETDGVPASRAGEIREGGRGENGRIGQVGASAPAQASKGVTPASHRAGANVPVPVDGRGTVRQGSRRKTWRPPQRASANNRNRRKGAERLRRAIPAGGPVDLPQGIGGTAGDVGGVCHVAPTRENRREVPTAPRSKQAAYGMGSTQPWGYPQTFQQPDSWGVQPHIPYEAGVAMGGAIYWPAPPVDCTQSYAPSVHATGNAGTQSPYLPHRPLPDVRAYYPQSSLTATGEGWDYDLQPRSGFPESAAAPVPSVRQAPGYCYAPPSYAAAVHQEYYAATAMGPEHSASLSAVGTAGAMGPVWAACVGPTNMNYPNPSGLGQGCDPLRDRAVESPCGWGFVQEQRVVPPPVSAVRGGFGGVAASRLSPEVWAPPPRQKALDWAGGAVFPQCGSVVSTKGGVGGGLCGGYRVPAGIGSGVPAAKAHTWQQGGSGQAGAGQAGAAPERPPYGGPASVSRAYPPCDEYGGWVATTQQSRFLTCGPPGYYHPEASAPPRQNVHHY